MHRPILLGLVAASIVSIAAFMTIDLRGDVWFALELRTVRLATIVQVAIAVAMSTVVFQTITNNRILTPSIMGMDSLFLLIQMTMVYLLGGLGYAGLDDFWKFAGETVLMTGLAAALFLPILRRGVDLLLLLLAGVVLGVLFRSLSSMLARVMDPNDYAVVQGASFADFNTVDATLLIPASLLTAGAALWFWRSRHDLDVMGLGREAAIGLGVDWTASALRFLLSVGVLVAASTALIGPVTFLGLLIVALGERLAGTGRHGPLFVHSVLIAIILLVGGQTLLAHGLGSRIPIGVLIEFVGGAVFLFLLFSERRT